MISRPSGFKENRRNEFQTRTGKIGVNLLDYLDFKNNEHRGSDSPFLDFFYKRVEDIGGRTPIDHMEPLEHIESFCFQVLTQQTRVFYDPFSR